MRVEAKIGCATTVENHEKIVALAQQFNISPSKAIHRSLTTFLSLQPEIIWEMEAAKTVLGYDIIAEINALIDEKKNRG